MAATTTADSPQQPAAVAVEPFKRPLLVWLYLIFAWTTGAMVTILELVGVPLQFAFHMDAVNQIVGYIHGVFLYPEYVVIAIIVAFKYRLSIGHMALMALAGLVAGLSPFVASRTVKHIEEKQVEQARRKAEKAARIAAKKERAAKKAAAAAGAGAAAESSAAAADAVPQASAPTVPAPASAPNDGTTDDAAAAEAATATTAAPVPADKPASV